ncbi:DUF3426 domain-containing protein [Desulfovulcanus sp.]
MIVQCPQCSTKYKIDESRLKPGVKLKCTRCQHLFSPDLLEEDDLELDVDLETQDSSVSEKQKEQEKKIDMGEEEEDSSSVKIEISSEKKRKPKKDPKTLLIISLFIVVLLGVAGAGVYYFFPQIKQFIPGLNFTGQVQEGLEQKQEKNEEKVKNISLENVRQYFVTNEKIGQLFVVEGQAVNRFNQPKELIKLRASLYDEQGNVVQSKEFYCGNVVSLFQLQVLSQEELEASLNAKLGILTNNTFIKPGGGTPFMVVFYAPPESVQEFGLKVIDVKDPPKK